MAWFCQNREGVKQGHESILTTEDAFVVSGVVPTQENGGDDLRVVDAGSGVITIKKGKAYVKFGDGVTDTALYIVRNTADYNMNVTGTGYKSVILVVDRTITPDSLGGNVAYPMIVDGNTDRAKNDAEIEALLGAEKPFLRLADLHWDGVVMKIADRRPVFTGFHLVEQNGQAPLKNKNLFCNGDFALGKWGFYSAGFDLVSYNYGGAYVNTGAAGWGDFKYVKFHAHPQDPNVWQNMWYVFSGRIHRVSGNGEVKVLVHWYDGTSWYDSEEQIVFLGGENDNSVRYFWYPFFMSSSFVKGELIIRFLGGNTEAYMTNFKLERGVVPTQFAQREIAFRINRVDIYGWPTDVSSFNFPFVLDLKNWGARELSFGAVLNLGLRDDDSWNAIEIKGSDRGDSFVSYVLNVEAQNGLPVMKSQGFVPLTTNQEIEVSMDNTLRSGAKIHLNVVGYWEFV